MPDIINLRDGTAARTRVTPENELIGPEEPKLIQTKAAAHPGESDEENEPAYPVLFFWETHEFDFSAEKGMFLLVSGIVLIAGGVAVVFFGSFLFALFLIIAGGLTAFYSFQYPRGLRVLVTSRGIVVGQRLYEFDELESFWIFYHPPLYRDLCLVSRKTFMPAIRAPLGDADPVALRDVLIRFLPEKRQEESVIDIIGKRIGF